ncbi:short-chain dehydrogenase/reductase [Colletotrichum abscissum]|uniref:Short-chain dehydrogenase/reductase n=1 Tax=Colletotrichum abscissum TaxID=1671311 RepID=A0A9P9X3R0_9PEZI|nr:short-chain dehydrogenase/reductase [Colletotrichum abscissum]KAI3535076.1 short-chain dehydrogenase/reductase [Colletotrichum abscissum]KAK1495562.1 short-chain dehydrogenase/reductase [Colletotrichum abscissum]
MPPFVFTASKTALITGGASGIGLAVAKKCLGHGMKVLIVDNNEGFLASAQRSLGEDKVSAAKADVSSLRDWAHLKKRVDSDFQGRIDFLFLNAGIQPSSAWDDPSTFQTIFNANLFGASQPPPPPGNPAYNASKSAVKPIAEHLSYDLRDSSPNTSVFRLVPGWTFTSLGRSEEKRTSAEKPAAAWTPEQVADYLEAKMAKDEVYVICPDNEVTEAMDAKRMLWAAEDVVQRRPALSRWRKEYKEEFEAWARS